MSLAACHFKERRFPKRGNPRVGGLETALA
jgi:hypothetical protein